MKDAVRTDEGPLKSLSELLEMEMEMEGPMLHYKLLYCTIQRNKICDNDGRRSKGQGPPGRDKDLRSPLLRGSVSTSPRSVICRYPSPGAVTGESRGDSA